MHELNMDFTYQLINDQTLQACAMLSDHTLAVHRRAPGLPHCLLLQARGEYFAVEYRVSKKNGT